MAVRRPFSCLYVCLALGVLGVARSAEPPEPHEVVPPPKPYQPSEVEALNYFRERIVRTHVDEVRTLIGMLGDQSYAVRQQASERLVRLQGRARLFLEKALDDPDPERRRRAQDCLSRLREETTEEVAAAARRLASAYVPGGLDLLVAYAPQALRDATLHELADAVATYIARDAEAERQVVGLLKDDWPARRALAAAALCRARGAAALPWIRPVLQDEELEARLFVGTTLVELNLHDGLPVLIDLFGRLSRKKLYAAEELLYQVAGEDAPAVGLGEAVQTRQRFRDAWLNWYSATGRKLDLASAKRPRYHDHTLILLLDEGMAVDLDAEDRPQWKMRDLGFPLDVQKLSGCRILVAEQGNGTITERHKSGVVLWEKKVAGPIVAQRLPNGNTFIATKSELLEVDRDGREIFGYERQTLRDQFMRAVKLPDGGYAFVTTRQRFYRLNAAREELFSFRVNVATFGGRIDVLPNGNVLIPQLRQHQVTEYDPLGNAVSNFEIDEPITATRLPNGNTLATSLGGMKVVEFDPFGRKIWEHKAADTRLNRAVRY